MFGGGGTQSSTVTQQLSPEASQAYQFRQQVAQNALANYGNGDPTQGAAYFTNPSNSPFVIPPGMQSAIEGVQKAAGNLPPDPTQNWALQNYGPAAQQYWNAAQQGPVTSQWNQGADRLGQYATQSIAGLNGGQWNQGAAAGAALAQSPINVGGIDMGAANVDFTATGATYDPVSVGTMAPVDVETIDPQRALEAARNHLATISSPAIRNALQASGLGRSGAEAEALAQEGVRLELPIEQQILQAKAQENQLEAQIKARQEEVMLLEQQKAKLQAQQLTATSREMAQQINGQLAGIEAQIRGRLAEAQFMGQVQASIAERTSALQYAAATLGQLAGMNTAQQQIGATTGLGLLGQLAAQNTAGYQGQMQAGGNILNNMTQMGAYIPALQNQQYQNQLLGAQQNLQASALPQQMAQQNWLNQQNYLLSLLGASPIPGTTATTTNNTTDPGIMNSLGTMALIGSLFKNS